MSSDRETLVAIVRDGWHQYAATAASQHERIADAILAAGFRQTVSPSDSPGAVVVEHPRVPMVPVTAPFDQRVDPLTARQIAEAFVVAHRDGRVDSGGGLAFEYIQNHGKDPATVRQVVVSRAVTVPTTEAVPRCPECGGELQSVRYPGGSLNRDQWDSVRAGDWYCATCPGSGDGTGYRYFWHRDLAAAVRADVPVPGEDMRDQGEAADLATVAERARWEPQVTTAIERLWDGVMPTGGSSLAEAVDHALTAPPVGDAPDQGVVAKVKDDNGEATLITIIDEDGDGQLRLIGDGGDVTAEFCTRRGGGQDPAFTAAVRRFIGAVQRSVAARGARHGT